jgi:hypothetical protein
MKTRGLLGSLAALMAGMFGHHPDRAPQRAIADPTPLALKFGKRNVWRRRPNRYSPHQGARECARRVRQLQQGILPASMLYTPPERKVAA